MVWSYFSSKKFEQKSKTCTMLLLMVRKNDLTSVQKNLNRKVRLAPCFYIGYVKTVLLLFKKIEHKSNTTH